ncbi:hypothetical protein CAPN001_22410 [Capnocytophaga stomatis]|uniref:hypothetical protein n=1 Tax=Capnocytophaga stomatis TaxID=1848904 RepID=UPI001951ECFF|nr:hypothetical protein [Capnocytophaga stomatis]GIJ97672.1 hypothetical protein CAPN001_22410 [Capnocytophaga stomatis]
MRILLVFLISAVAFGQNLKTDWQKENLKGKVKSVESIAYRYVGNEGKKEALSNFNTQEKYNDKGFKIFGRRFTNEGKTSASWRYFYDDKNHLTKVEILNEKNQVEEVLKYIYEAKVQKEEVLGYDASGKLTGKQVASYDEKGNKINELSLTADGAFLLRQEIVYDAKSNVSEKRFEDKEGKKVLLKYVYDDKNNIIEENYYGEGNQLYGQKIFSYKYDSKGNWTQRTERIYDVERVVTERKIEYF